MTGSAVRVDDLSLPDALALGPAAWDGLQRGAPVASPFSGWAWHRAWADAASPEDLASARALVLRSDTTIAALLPFRVSRARFRRAPVRALGWAAGDLGCPDHLDLPALPDADLEAIVSGLEALSWDVMMLDNIAERAPQLGRLLDACSRRGWAVQRAPLWPCPFLQLPGSWDEYLATLTPTRRQTIRRKERNLHRRHAVTVTDYGPDRWDEGWARLQQLHSRRWDGPGAFAEPVVERMHRVFGSLLAERGGAWLTTLDLNGMPAAAWYGFAVADTVCFYQGGWDPQFEGDSVGAVLMGIMIRRAIERGFRTFDFLRGEEPYKMNWTSTSRASYEVSVIRPGWRGAALRVLDGLARGRQMVARV